MSYLKKSQFLPILGILMLFLFILCGCETSAPEILSVQWQINLVDDLVRKKAEEHLSFYVSVNDEDGVEDISSVYLLNDETEQFWTFEAANWTVFSRDEEYWLGSSDVVMPDRSSIPRGSYRVMVFDTAGERSEMKFNINTVTLNPQKIAFPKISAKDGIVTLNSQYNNVNMVLYDRGNYFMDSYLLEYDKFAIEHFPRYRELTQARGVKLYLYTWVADKGYGLFSGPYVGLYDDAQKKDK